MNNDDTLSATFWAMVIVQTIGSVDMPGKGERKMPAPRAYVAIVVLWGTLALVAEAGQRRIANALSVLVLFTGMVAGPFGQRIASFYNTIGTDFGSTQS